MKLASGMTQACAQVITVTGIRVPFPWRGEHKCGRPKGHEGPHMDEDGTVWTRKHPRSRDSQGDVT